MLRFRLLLLLRKKCANNRGVPGTGLFCFRGRRGLGLVVVVLDGLGLGRAHDLGQGSFVGLLHLCGGSKLPEQCLCGLRANTVDVEQFGLERFLLAPLALVGDGKPVGLVPHLLEQL